MIPPVTLSSLEVTSNAGVDARITKGEDTTRSIGIEDGRTETERKDEEDLGLGNDLVGWLTAFWSLRQACTPSATYMMNLKIDTLCACVNC